MTTSNMNRVFQGDLGMIVQDGHSENDLLAHGRKNSSPSTSNQKDEPSVHESKDIIDSSTPPTPPPTPPISTATLPRQITGASRLGTQAVSPRKRHTPEMPDDDEGRPEKKGCGGVFYYIRLVPKKKIRISPLPYIRFFERYSIISRRPAHRKKNRIFIVNRYLKRKVVWRFGEVRGW